MKFAIYNAHNERQEVDLGAHTLEEMRAADVPTIGKLIEKKVGPTGDQPSALAQVAAQMGIHGGSKVADVMSGKNYIGPEGSQAATVGGDGSITGRLLLQATLFESIESHLRTDLGGYAKMLADNAAIRRTISDLKWDTPILDYTRPANARPQPVAQLSEPTRMMTLKTSGRSNTLMGDSIGIEFSDQVARDTTLDIVSLSVKRMAEESAAALAMYQIDSLYLGDADYGMQDLPTAVGGATASKSLDSNSVLKLTQKAWMKWLFNNGTVRTIDLVITDMEGALAIANRDGRPEVNNRPDNDPGRIDTLESIANPFWPDRVKVIVTQSPSWPPNVLVGVDSRFGYNYVSSTALNYSAVEEFAIRRSTKMRFDTGSMVERNMNDAWDILTISQS